MSVGLLNERDLNLLGKGFTRHFPVTDDGMFDVLLARLDSVEAEPFGKGVVLRAQIPDEGWQRCKTAMTRPPIRRKADGAIPPG